MRPYRVHPRRTFGFRGTGALEDMQLVVASACCDLDATISASYGGSGQTWANLVASPSDGASQTDYDFHVGLDASATATDPTFTGSAGTQSAYWALDGGDYFTLKSFTSTQAALWNMHRTDASNPWWIAIAFQSPAGSKKGFWGNSWVSTDIGLYLWQEEAGGQMYVGNPSTLESQVFTSASYSANTPSVIIISGDNNATTNNVKSWHNTKTGTTYSKTWASNTGTPNNTFIIGATHDGTSTQSIMLNNSRIYGWSCGDELLNDTKAGLIIDEYNTRHNRTYA